MIPVWMVIYKLNQLWTLKNTTNKGNPNVDNSSETFREMFYKRSVCEQNVYNQV